MSKRPNVLMILDGYGLNSNEAGNAVAEAAKKMILGSKMSREQIVDGVNAYFNRTEKGASTTPPECLGMLTLNMLNNYLGKPAEYRLPAYMVFALQEVTKSFEIARLFAEAIGGEVATADEAKQLRIVKLQDTQHKAKQLEKELRELMSKN